MPAASLRAVAVVLSGALGFGPALGQSNVAPVAQSERGAAETIDADAVNRIKDEESKRSRVMETLSYLSDVYGPRLTGSPN
ncbi:MAG: hypothetical protein M3268_04555, partial [Acidobacteriota bacterium]|nr:hypothetical protein [Acidobacteriota bacterium]